MHDLKAGDVELSPKISNMIDEFCAQQREEYKNVRLSHFLLDHNTLYAIVLIKGHKTALRLPYGWKIHPSKHH